jgi:hypothetical protein
MGNRGILHDRDNNVVSPWLPKVWVTCILSFKGVVRPQPSRQGRYAEVFFLDEVTAFAAGHRPCARCQRERHLEFKSAWLQANVPEDVRSSMTVSEIDNVLHSERTTHAGGKRSFDARLSELPLGAMFEHEGLAYLLDARGCLQWSFGGYGSPKAIDTATTVKLLTPPSIVRVFANGFAPLVHHSASGSVPSRLQ